LRKNPEIERPRDFLARGLIRDARRFVISSVCDPAMLPAICDETDSAIIQPQSPQSFLGKGVRTQDDSKAPGRLDELPFGLPNR